ncbi:MAG: ATP-binding cassette domain-containing protein [Propionibacteriaceae bacterium]|jgi:ABC-2 type transport system ATP-binding protein|nr:ATP-binding cassette domain-containing protein [Propionibacteriaceae bacterium]
MSRSVVEVDRFRMDFGANTVVRDLSFSIAPGETFGFLGSNGSGKTTTIRALLGIYQPTAGKLLVNGRPFRAGSQIRTGEKRTVLGYLPEERGLYKKEPVIDTMIYFGRLKGMAAKAASAWSMAYLERVGLATKAKQRLDKCSGGEQQKVQLGVTVMNNPDLLILDEPTKGFDPVNRRLLLDIIDEHKRAGATVMMVTHHMEEVERLCDRILLLKDGVARAYGSVAAVQEQFGATTVKVDCRTGSLPESPNYRVLSNERGMAEIELTSSVKPSAVLAELIRAGVGVEAFTPSRRSLDSIFVEVYGEQAGRE